MMKSYQIHIIEYTHLSTTQSSKQQQSVKGQKELYIKRKLGPMKTSKWIANSGCRSCNDSFWVKNITISRMMK